VKSNTACSSLPEENDLFEGSFEDDFGMEPIKYSPRKSKNKIQNAELINIKKRKLLDQKTKLRSKRCKIRHSSKACYHM